ncbi:Tyrosine kinase-like (TKL) protein, putative [Eimeria mitis]|uniref:Tyrosine kinase-like (TKL) protein, putative n=1 Tax=Eimeria mitis TaxID=44415 RepID=U6KN94_9EIME|nr:Tyrosine kinase-like (TKL) protein, putative [Eimeria mitis]CDJ36908.1 Tyrosine kinase-like (TKL) protein, putative [Eimeria mitis]
MAQTSAWLGALERPDWPVTPPVSAAAAAAAVTAAAAAATGGGVTLGCDCVACRGSSGRSSCCLRGLKARLEALNLGVDPRELKINSRIGSGASGTVLKAVWRGCDVAVKVLPMVQQQLLQQEQQQQQQGRSASAAAAAAAAAAARELQIMKRLRCPNLVLLMGACALDTDAVCSSSSSISSGRNSSSGSLSSNSAAELLAASGCCGPGLAVVMELCAGGSLFGLLHGKPEDALAAVAAKAPAAAPAAAPAHRTTTRCQLPKAASSAVRQEQQQLKLQ